MGKNTVWAVYSSAANPKQGISFLSLGKKKFLRWNFPLRFSFIWLRSWSKITNCISQIPGTSYTDSPRHQNRSKDLSQDREIVSNKDKLLSKSEVIQYSNVQSIMQDLSLLLSKSIPCNVRSQGDTRTGQVGGVFCKGKEQHTVIVHQLPGAWKKFFKQYVTCFSI